MGVDRRLLQHRRRDDPKVGRMMELLLGHDQPILSELVRP
jgi:hypothetical protein